MNPVRNCQIFHAAKMVKYRRMLFSLIFIVLHSQDGLELLPLLVEDVGLVEDGALIFSYSLFKYLDLFQVISLESTV